MSVSEGTALAPLATIASHELLSRLRVLTSRAREVDAELLVHLGEVDARRLYLDEAYPSMFEYCVRALHFEESVACNRIHVARAARRHPELLEALWRGELHLTGLRLIAPHLTRENSEEWLLAARHRSVAEIRRLIADREPRPDVPASIRRQPAAPSRARQACAPRWPSAPTPRPAPSAAGERRLPEPLLPSPASGKPRSEPLGEGRYCVRFTADRGLYEKLEELRSLLRHQVPDGDLAKILNHAVDELLAKVRKRRFAELDAPSTERRQAASTPTDRAKPASRHIPNAIRRAVWQRDGGRCSFVSRSGRRCGSRDFLEFDHLEPWAYARKHSEAGIALRCRAHNQAAARHVFGAQHMDRFASGPAERSNGELPRLDLDQVARRAPDGESPDDRRRAPNASDSRVLE